MALSNLIIVVILINSGTCQIFVWVKLHYSYCWGHLIHNTVYGNNGTKLINDLDSDLYFCFLENHIRIIIQEDCTKI